MSSEASKRFIVQQHEAVLCVRFLHLRHTFGGLEFLLDAGRTEDIDAFFLCAHGLGRTLEFSEAGKRVRLPTDWWVVYE